MTHVIRSTRRALTNEEIEHELPRIPLWRFDDGKLQRELVFADFPEAFGFMSALALHAQALNHHPAFRNVYNRVQLELWTHDVSGITALDFELARVADTLAASFRR